MNFDEIFQFCPKCGSKHFDKNNEKSRKCDNCGFVYYMNPSSSTAAFIINGNGELLVCRRGKEPAKGTLDLPGGFVDFNETGEETMEDKILRMIQRDALNLPNGCDIMNPPQMSRQSERSAS